MYPYLQSTGTLRHSQALPTHVGPPVVRDEPGHQRWTSQLRIGELEGVSQLQDDVVAHVIPQVGSKYVAI
jgi:hypothetical protein